MSAIDAPDYSTRKVRFRGATAIWSLIAAGLFLGSAALQLVASLQRWVVFRISSGEFLAQDHLYDYTVPYSPWENIGTSAQLFGAGTLLLPLGVLAMAVGVLALPRTAARRGVVAVVLDVSETVLAILIAGSFGISGAHALVSGITDTPSPLHQYMRLGWVAILALIVLIMRWARKSPTAMMACVLLLGSTELGYYIAAFHIAPIFAGYVSHDTTPWTETVVAVWTALAGVAMILTAREATRRRAPRAD